MAGATIATSAVPEAAGAPRQGPVVSAALVVMVQRGPALEQERARVELSKYQVKSARTRYWPRIGNISISRSGSGIGFYGFDDDKFDRPPSPAFPNGVDAFRYNTSCCQFSVSMTLWDNFAREDQMVSARINAENAQANLRDQTLGQQQQLAQYIGTLRTTEAQMQVQRLSLAAAEGMRDWGNTTMRVRCLQEYLDPSGGDWLR